MAFPGSRPATQTANVTTAAPAARAPLNRFGAVNFGPQGKPDLPRGDHTLEIVAGDPRKDPGAETGRYFYTPPGRSADGKLAFCFKIVESNDPKLVGFECVHRCPLRVNSQGSDQIVFQKIGRVLFSLFGVDPNGAVSNEDKAYLDVHWDEFVERGTLDGQSLVGQRCKVRVYEGKNPRKEGGGCYDEKVFSPAA